MAKGSDTTAARRRLAENICAAYPEAEVIEDLGTPHNRVNLGRADPLALNEEGKRTLVLAEHKRAVRQSTEEGNSCPNFWHFSPYGFCPYGDWRRPTPTRRRAHHCRQRRERPPEGPLSDDDIRTRGQLRFIQFLFGMPLEITRQGKENPSVMLGRALVYLTFEETSVDDAKRLLARSFTGVHGHCAKGTVRRLQYSK